MNTEQLYEIFLQHPTVTTDSRHCPEGSIFFALRGESFDGNTFAAAALAAGCAYAVVDEHEYATDPRCLLVSDVLETLQQLAALHRRKWGHTILQITGTNGKTTTKELVHAVLAKRYKTSATAGNFNNHLGVPLTLLSIPTDAQIAIVEMGANHPGEIADLCGIADPDCGLITNVGRAHLEGFGSFEGVVKTKTELYRHLASKKGLVFVNADNERLTQEAKGMKTCTYGRSESADVRGTYVGSDPYLHFYFEVGDNVYNVRTHLLGAYNFDNCMAAVAMGLRFGVEPFDIKEAIEEYIPANQRSQWKETDNNKLYLDCYNANPSSMAAAIASFAEMNTGTPKVAIIGAMRELGDASVEEHCKLVQALNNCHLEHCLLIGHEFDGITLGPNMTLMHSTEEAAEWLKKAKIQGKTILVKGSNSNKLWTLEQLL